MSPLIKNLHAQVVINVSKFLDTFIHTHDSNRFLLNKYKARAFRKGLLRGYLFITDGEGLSDYATLPCSGP